MIRIFNGIIERIYDFVVLKIKSTYKYTIIIIELTALFSFLIVQTESIIKSMLFFQLYVVGFVFISITGLLIQSVLLIIATLLTSLIFNNIQYNVSYDFFPSHFDDDQLSIDNWRFWTSQLAYTWLYTFTVNRIYKHGFSLSSLIYILVTSVLGVPLANNLMSKNFMHLPMGNNPIAIKFYTYLFLLMLNIFYALLYYLVSLLQLIYDD